MHYAMVSPTKSIGFQQTIGISDEIAVGKKEKFHQVQDVAVFPAS